MTSKKVTNLSEKIHSRAFHRDKNTVIDQENNIRISLPSPKSISENRDKLNGLLLSSKNTKFEFGSLLGLKSVLDATLLTFQEDLKCIPGFF